MYVIINWNNHWMLSFRREASFSSVQIRPKICTMMRNDISQTFPFVLEVLNIWMICLHPYEMIISCLKWWEDYFTNCPVFYPFFAARNTHPLHNSTHADWIMHLRAADNLPCVAESVQYSRNLCNRISASPSKTISSSINHDEQRCR